MKDRRKVAVALAFWAQWGLALLLLLPVPAASQTLMDVYHKARLRDAQFAMAGRTLDAALEKLPQARAGLLPSLTLSGSGNRQSGSASFSYEPFVERDVKSWSWTAQLTQPLFRWSNWIGYQQADAAVVQARAQFAVAEQELMLRAAQAYFDVLSAIENVYVMEAQLRAVNEQLVLAQRNLEVGTGTITDVHEAKAKHALGVAQHVAAMNELSSKQAELERLTDEPASALRRRVVRSLPPMRGDQLETWLAAAAANSLQIRIQQAALEVAQREVDKSKAQHLPTLDLVVNRSANFSSGTLSAPADLATRVYSQQVGVQFSVPLFSGGATQSRVRESLALEDRAREELTSARRSTASQVRQGFAGVINGQAQSEALEAAVEASGNAVASNKIGFMIGTRINPDVLNAEQQLYAALRDLARARIETIMQGLKLKAAAGVLQAEDLAALDPLTEPLGDARAGFAGELRMTLRRVEK